MVSDSVRVENIVQTFDEQMFHQSNLNFFSIRASITRN